MSSFTGRVSSAAPRANSALIFSAWRGAYCASTELWNFFTSTGMPSARRLRCPMGKSTATRSVALPSLKNTCSALPM